MSRHGPITAYRLILKRHRLLWRSFRSRHALTSVADRTASIRPDDILVVMVVRNEALRLPWFLEYYRGLGVGHFLIVDNQSTDGTAELLAQAPDVSLWTTPASYREARFGLDWASWLLMHYGHGHWCLLLDADELLVYAHHRERNLPDLTCWLEGQGRLGFGALMLDMYPRGPLGSPLTEPNTDPIKDLCWFDSSPYKAIRQEPMRNLWVQGGARERVFFRDMPGRSPTLNKLPLIKWNRRWAYVNSTHSILPSGLNRLYDGPGGKEPSGVLLHTKFLHDVVDRATEDIQRKQHFHDPEALEPYYREITTQPTMWHEGSVRYQGWEQLEALGLMNSGGW